VKVLEDYISELTQDVQIDEFSMKDVQMKLPAIKHKWTGRLIRAKIDIQDSYNKKYFLVNDLADRLVTESPITISTVLAKKKVEEHQQVRDLNHHIKEMKLIVEFLEKTERTLSSITFDIRNLVEIIKLETQ
tara:strand:+ start:1056 stop:1451 length:396 start_codon:yes stop_codon:yes gene_type:complete